MMLIKYLAGFAVVAGLFFVDVARGQENADSEFARQQQIADKFLDVLLKRPRPGTALDRVYGHYVQSGSLDALIERLDRESQSMDPSAAGSRAMLVGLLKLQRGADAKAAESLARAEKLLESDAMASYYLGKALLLVGRTDAAAEALERSIDRQPARNEALPVFTDLGRLYGRAGETQKSLAVWTRLEKTFPGDARVGEQIATTLADEGQSEAALARFETLAAQSDASDESKVVGYRIAAAELKRALGRHDEALSDLESLLAKLRPGSWLHSDVRRRIEAGFLRSGDYAALADYYAKQVATNPDDVDTRLRLGRSLAKSGRLNEAAQSLLATIELAPENVDARLTLNDIYRLSAKPAEAAKQYEALVQLDPANPDYLVRWGNVLLDDVEVDKAQRQRAAAAIWLRLADARTDDPVVTAQVADLLRSIDDTETAIKLYHRAIDLAPNQPQYREYLGEYLFKLKRTDEALVVWNQLAQPPRRTRENLIRLAEVLATFKFPDKAIETFAEAAKMDPTFGERMRFAELLKQATKYDDALAQLDEAQSVAEAPDEHAQVFAARIQVYSASGTLRDRIAEATTHIDQGSATTVDYRRLAMLHDAAADSVSAIQAAEKAIAIQDDDTESLLIVAELYRKTARHAEAIEAFTKLSKLDTRYFANYLQRIAGLQMQLGKIDEALVTGNELISAQPGNPEPYRYYAGLCFQANRDDEGIETLRRAMRAAPRDNETRNALASALSERFRSDEAIELYWASLEATDDLDEQKMLVTKLGELYERKADLDRLVSRIEARGREKSDMRTATLLTAEMYRSVGDFGIAQDTLRPLLAENPRDVDLLTQMVSLANQSDDVDQAVLYQEQLVSLADTPENRRAMLELLVDAGRVSDAEAQLQRMRGMDDAKLVTKMIDRVIDRSDYETAIRMCEMALAQQSDLWEVQLRLAVAYLLNGNDEKADETAQSIRDLQLPLDTQAASYEEPKKPTGMTDEQFAAQKAALASRENRTSNLYSLASLIASDESRYYSSGQRRTSGLAVNVYGQAEIAAQAVQVVIAKRQGKLDERFPLLLDDGTIASTSDVRKLQDSMDAVRLRLQLTREQTESRELQRQSERVTWRIAELAPEESLNLMMNLVQQRVSQRTQAQRGSGQEPPEKLTDKQIELLLATMDAAVEKFGSINRGYGHYIKVWVHGELVAAGRESDAEAIRQEFAGTCDSIKDATTKLQFALASNDEPRVQEIFETVRQNISEWAVSATPVELASFAQLIGSQREGTITFTPLAIDVVIAAQVAANQGGNQVQQSSQAQQTGTLHVYYDVDGNYQQFEISVPFASRLLPSSFVQSFFQSTKFGKESSERTQLLAYLKEDHAVFVSNPDLATEERRFRRTLAAFASWWAKDPTTAYNEIVRLSRDFPEDNDLWIERARLAAELKRPREALEALDSISPLDQKTLETRELAAMNLATQLGEIDRAKEAAARLFGMRLDQTTQLSLASQLGRMGMRDMATAMLQRTRHRGGQTAQDLLQIANEYSQVGDNEAAAEVAFAALRRLNRDTNNSNDSYYRRQAVTLLAKVGRMDKLLAQAEQRVKSAPKSIMLKSELAELYVAAGRQSDANALYEDLAKSSPNDPKTLLAAAKQLTQVGKHSEAIDKFIAAFKKDPSLLQREFYEMERAVMSSNDVDSFYTKILELDLKSLDSYSVGRMANLYRRGSQKPTDNAIKFIDKVLKESPPDALGEVLRNIQTTKEIASSETVRATVKRIFEDDSIYSNSSRFWSAVSWSSGGRINGALTPCLELMSKDKELSADILAGLEKRAEQDQYKDVAKPLLLVARMAQVNPNETTTAGRELIGDKESKTPYTLWWQIGETLDQRDDLRLLAIEILEFVRDHPSNQRNGLNYQYGINAKLTQSYLKAGENQKARDQLVIAFESMDNSRYNQGNPGYGDYQDLQSCESIASDLVKAKSPLDAIRVYSHSLSQPQKFDAAKQWSGSRNYRESFEKGLSTALDSLTPDDFRHFLFRIAADPKETGTEKDLTSDPSAAHANDDTSATRIDLVSLTPTFGTAPDQTSIAAMVVSKLAQQDDGHSELEGFSQQLPELIENTPQDWSLLAMQVLVATELRQPEDAAASLQRISEIISEKNFSDPNANTKADRVLSLYSPTLVALASDDEGVKNIATTLAKQLTEIAKAREDSAIARTLSLALVRSSGVAPGTKEMDDAIRELLDSTAPPSEPPAVLSDTVATECLKIAELALQSSSPTVALEAIRRSLAGGPPLKLIQAGSSSSNPFAIRTSSRSSGTSNESIDADLQAIAFQVGDLIEKIDSHGGNEQEIYQTLLNVILPQQRPSEVFPYMVTLAGTGAVEKTDKPYDTGECLVNRLAVAAVKSKQDAELERVLTERRETAENKGLIEMIATAVAVARQDKPQADARLRSMAEAMGISFDESAKVSLSTKAPFSADVNSLLHAALPVIKLVGATETTDVVRGSLLQLHSNEPALTYTPKVWSVLANDLVKTAMATDARLLTWIQGYMRGVEINYSRYSGGSATYILNASSDIVQSAITGKRWSLARSLIRPIALQDPGLAEHTQNQKLVATAIGMVDASPEERYAFYKQVMFGEGKNEPIADWNGYLIYDVPPKVIEYAAIQLKRIRKLPLADPDFAVLTTSKLVAEAAAEAGKTDELIGLLKPFVTDEGDETDAMIGLAQLASGNLKETSATLDRVVKYLSPAPKTEKPLKLFATSMLLTECLSVDELNATAARGVKHLFAHVRKTDKSHLKTLLPPIAAKSGTTIAAGATKGSPKPHWIPVQVPHRSQVESPLTEPVFRMRDDSISIAGGTDFSQLMFMYPLQGDFSLTFTCVSHGYSDGGVAFGGIGFSPGSFNRKVTLTALQDRGTKEFSFEEFEPNKDYAVELAARGDSVTLLINGTEIVKDVRTDRFPFVGLLSRVYAVAEFSKIRLSGDATIPRRVNMIDRELRGWFLPIYYGLLPPLPLPISPNDDAADYKKRYDDHLLAMKERGSWYADENGHLRTGGANDGYSTFNYMKHMQYIRPLCKDETISYEFYYEPGKQEIHPTIGRTAILLRKDGVKLRWLKATGSQESLDANALNGKKPNQLIGDGSYELVPNDWNRVTLHSTGANIRVSINGKDVCEVETGPLKKPGFLTEQDRTGDIRQLTLSGEWPASLADVP